MVLSRNLSGGTEYWAIENLRIVIFRRILEPGTSRIRRNSASHKHIVWNISHRLVRTRGPNIYHIMSFNSPRWCSADWLWLRPALPRAGLIASDVSVEAWHKEHQYYFIWIPWYWLLSGVVIWTVLWRRMGDFEAKLHASTVLHSCKVLYVFSRLV
jgi:hypothetical protein